MANRKSITTSEEFTRNITQYTNIDDSQITIMESILKNILLEHKQSVQAGSDWKTPLGICISIVAFLGVGDFSRDFLNISKETWNAGFLLMLVGSVLWICHSLYLRWMNKDENLDTLLIKIKASERTTMGKVGR